MILPVPSVAANVVARAENGDRLLSPESSMPSESLIAYRILCCGKCSFNVKYVCVPKRIIRRGMPHIKSLAACMICNVIHRIGSVILYIWKKTAKKNKRLWAKGKGV